MAMIAVSMRARPGHEDTLRDRAGALCDAAGTFPGHLDAHLTREDQGGHQLLVVLTFDSTGHLLEWERSDERHHLLDQCRDSMLVPSRRLSAADLNCALLGAHPGEPVSPPSRWRTMVWVWITLFPTSTILGYLPVPQLEPLPLPVRTLITTVVTVPFLILIAIPAAQSLRDRLLGRFRTARR